MRVCRALMPLWKSCGRMELEASTTRTTSYSGGSIFRRCRLPFWMKNCSIFLAVTRSFGTLCIPVKVIAILSLSRSLRLSIVLSHNSNDVYFKGTVQNTECWINFPFFCTGQYFVLMYFVLIWHKCLVYGWSCSINLYLIQLTVNNSVFQTLLVSQNYAKINTSLLISSITVLHNLRLGWLGSIFQNNFGGESVAFNAQVGSLAMTEWLVQLYGNLHDYFDAFIFFSSNYNHSTYEWSLFKWSTVHNSIVVSWIA